MKCRHCQAQLSRIFLDLGSAPPSNAYLTAEGLRAPEVWYPLRVFVCDNCRLVQTDDLPRHDTLFAADYAYYSSYSDTWLNHSSTYAEAMRERFHLDAKSKVVEVASNDGYLLQYFQKAHIPCLGVEPTHGPASAARLKGLEVVEAFFGRQLALQLVQQGHQADLMVANNVLAHVPDINDFVDGFSLLLKDSGVVTFEFPHLLSLVRKNQFDTIYHEHFSYLSLTTVNKIFTSQGLLIFDIEVLATHGGSLRVYAQRTTGRHPQSERVDQVLAEEILAGMGDDVFYDGMQKRAEQVKHQLLGFLLEARQKGWQVAAYGAAAKGNTLLNFCGIRQDLVEYVVDRNPAKCGKFLPGSHIPIVDESILKQRRPDVVLILPWNLCAEITRQLHYARDWGGRFVTAIPGLEFH